MSDLATLMPRSLSALCSCMHTRQTHAALTGVCAVCGPEHEVWEINDYTSGERVRYFVDDEPTAPQGTKPFEWSAYSHLEGCGAYVVRAPATELASWWRVPAHYLESA